MSIKVHILSLNAPEDPTLSRLYSAVAECGFFPEIARGVNGRELKAGEYFDHIKPYYIRTRRIMTPGEVGCTLGHVAIWNSIASSDDGVGVVLEDDALIDSAFVDALPALVAVCKATDAWVSLGGQEIYQDLTRTAVGRRVTSVPSTWEILPSDYSKIFGNVGYVITSSTAMRLIEVARKGLFLADDFAFLSDHGAIKHLLLSNLVGHPWTNFRSAIESERDLRRTVGRIEPQPLLKRLWKEVRSTVQSRLSPRTDDAPPPDGYEKVEWISRFRELGS